jgi:hypothetical protein
VPGLDNLKGLGSGLGIGKRDVVLVTGGAGQLGAPLLAGKCQGDAMVLMSRSGDTAQTTRALQRPHS